MDMCNLRLWLAEQKAVARSIAGAWEAFRAYAASPLFGRSHGKQRDDEGQVTMEPGRMTWWAENWPAGDQTCVAVGIRVHYRGQYEAGFRAQYQPTGEMRSGELETYRNGVRTTWTASTSPPPCPATYALDVAGLKEWVAAHDLERAVTARYRQNLMTYRFEQPEEYWRLFRETDPAAIPARITVIGRFIDDGRYATEEGMVALRIPVVHEGAYHGDYIVDCRLDGEVVDDWFFVT